MRAMLKKIFIPLLISLFCQAAVAQGNNFTLADWPATAPALKPVYVKAIMEQAGIHGVSFTRDANFYVAELDRLARFAEEKNYRPYLQLPVAQNLATIAIVHCDWNNGVEPQEFAQKLLGKQLGLLTPLYGEAINKLQQNCQ